MFLTQQGSGAEVGPLYLKAPTRTERDMDTHRQWAAAPKSVAEMVATLYDESLDAFQQHNWLQRFSFSGRTSARPVPH